MVAKLVDLIPQKPEPNAALIAELRYLLSEAEQGHLITMIGTFMSSNSTVHNVIIGNLNEHYITNLGMIEDLKDDFKNSIQDE